MMRQQRIAAVADGLGVVALLGVERACPEKPAHADHGVHRRADLVAHGGEEGALGRVGLLGGGAGVLRFVEQAHVLNGDHSLVAEGMRDRNFVGGEWPPFLPDECQ